MSINSREHYCFELLHKKTKQLEHNHQSHVFVPMSSLTRLTGSGWTEGFQVNPIIYFIFHLTNSRSLDLQHSYSKVSRYI